MGAEVADHYGILGIPPTADSKTIRQAYFRLAAICHPDHAGDDQQSVQRFRDAAAAYAVLSDPKKREKYDRGRLPKSIQDFMLHNPAARAVMEVMLPSPPIASQRGVDLLIVADGQGKVLTDAATADLVEFVPPSPGIRWVKVPRLGSVGRNGGPGGDLWVLVPAGPHAKRS